MDDEKVVHPNVAAALVAARSEFHVIESKRSATIEMQRGGSYSYKYADLADAIEVTGPILAKHGLAVLTPVHAHGEELAVTVIVIHESGSEFRFDPFPFSEGANAQATGSAVTYHRRYAYLSALGIATRDDDDDAPRRAEKGRGQRKCVVCDKTLSGPAVPGGGGFAHPECVTPAANPDEEPF